MAGGGERGIHFFTNPYRNFERRDVDVGNHFKDINADVLDAVGWRIGVGGQDQREGGDVRCVVVAVVGDVGWKVRDGRGWHDAARRKGDLPARRDLVVQHQPIRGHVVARVGQVDGEGGFFANHGINDGPVVPFCTQHWGDGDGEGLGDGRGNHVCAVMG